MINAYSLKAIDIDIENTDEFESEVVQDRILGALKIVKQNNPNLKTIVTIRHRDHRPDLLGHPPDQPGRGACRPMSTSGPSCRSTSAAAPNMYASHGERLGRPEERAEDRVRLVRRHRVRAHGHLRHERALRPAGAHHHRDLDPIRNWAESHGLARLAFWSVNRDRGCAGGGVSSDCTGIAQPDWEFTRITAQFG